jgi:hypothetical protein
MPLHLTNRPPRLSLAERFRKAGSQVNGGRYAGNLEVAEGLTVSVVGRTKVIDQAEG